MIICPKTDLLRCRFEAYSPLGGPDLGGKSVMNYPAVQLIAKVSVSLSLCLSVSLSLSLSLSLSV
eukprot:COSAG03_NODE_955_length_5196_cov_3.042770_5_plen_64_part_01